MQPPDNVFTVSLIVLAVSLSVILFGLIAAGVYDDYNRWRSKKRGPVSFAFPSFREGPATSEESGLPARDGNKAEAESMEETLRTGVR